MGKRKSAMLVFRIVEILRNNATKENPMKLRLLPSEAMRVGLILDYSQGSMYICSPERLIISL